MWQPQMEHFNRPRTRRRPRPRLESGSSSESVVETERERKADSIAVPPKIFEDEDDDEYEDEGGLLRAWRVIVPDLRGYGQSTVVPGKTTLDIFASDIAVLLDELGIQELVIGGLSMGGQIVMEFCRLYPGRIRGILLAATFCRAETEEGRRQRAVMADRLLKEGMQPSRGRSVTEDGDASEPGSASTGCRSRARHDADD